MNPSRTRVGTQVRLSPGVWEEGRSGKVQVKLQGCAMRVYIV